MEQRLPACSGRQFEQHWYTHYELHAPQSFTKCTQSICQKKNLLTLQLPVTATTTLLNTGTGILLTQCIWIKWGFIYILTFCCDWNMTGLLHRQTVLERLLSTWQKGYSVGELAICQDSAESTVRSDYLSSSESSERSVLYSYIQMISKKPVTASVYTDRGASKHFTMTTVHFLTMLHIPRLLCCKFFLLFKLLMVINW